MVHDPLFNNRFVSARTENRDQISIGCHTKQNEVLEICNNSHLRLADFLHISRQIRFLFRRKVLNTLLTSWKTFNDLVLN